MSSNDPRMCVLNNFRKLTRVMAQKMDAALAPMGIKSTQYSLLVTLRETGPIQLSHLANVLMMERTTLTRNLKPLIEKAWVEQYPGDDQRVKNISITPEGIALIEQSHAAWQHQQEIFIEQIGHIEWSKQFESVAAIARAIADE